MMGKIGYAMAYWAFAVGVGASAGLVFNLVYGIAA